MITGIGGVAMPIHIRRLLKQQINSHFFNGVVCTALGVMMMRASSDLHALSFIAAAAAFATYLSFSIFCMHRTLRILDKPDF